MKKLRTILSIIICVCILGGGITGIVCGFNQSKVNDKVEEQVTLINTTIDDMKSTNTTLDSNINSLTTRVTTLESTLTIVQTTINGLSDDLDDTKEKLTNVETNLMKEINLIKEDIVELKEKDASLQNQINTLTTALENEINNVKEWTSETYLTITNWTAFKSEIDNTVESLNEKVTSIESSITTINTTLLALQNQIDKNTQDIKDLQDLTEHLKNCINGKHEIDTSTYTWADDFSSCTASSHCKYCGAECEIITTNISYSNFKLTATFDSKDNIEPVVLDISDATNFTNDQIKNAVGYMIGAGEADSVDVKLTLASDAGKDVFEVICDALQVAENGSVNLSIDGVNSIPKSAFASSLIIKSLSLGENVKKIDTLAFYGCYNLSFVDLGCVEVIGENSFSGTKLTEISIPSTVKVISKTAFFASGLTTITIPSTIEEIGIGAFNFSQALTSVTIENGITKIENYAFKYCTSLSTITIPKSVTVIGIGSFEQCKIENIYYGGTKEDWEKISFDSSWNINSNVETYTVHFSDGTTESYSHN